MPKVISRDTIVNGENFIIKWSKNPGSKRNWNPAWKQQTEADEFLVHIENVPSILNDMRFIRMDSKEYDISYLRATARLQAMKELTGDNAGAQRTKTYTDLDEVVPEFSRNELVAEAFSAFTWTPKTFLLENIEKEDFLEKMEALLAEQVGYSAENIAMYGIKKNTGATADGLDHLDGIFQQLKDVKDIYDEAKQGANFNRRTPRGYFDDLDASKEIIPQLKKMVTAFSVQKGKRNSAKLYVSTELEGMILEEADKRETEAGDKIYFDGTNVFIWGVPVVQADFLDVPENNFGEQVLLADPDSLVAGFVQDITSENDYKLEYKAYLSSVDVYFGVLILWNKDALAASVKNMPSALASGDEPESP